MDLSNDHSFFAPAANPVFFRTYSRQTPGGREAWKDVCYRTTSALAELGSLTESEAALIYRMQADLKALPSGRWLWVGGTEWAKQPENFSGAYNCTSTNLTSWQDFGRMMDLAMMGCGTGAVLEQKYIGHLPQIKNRLSVSISGSPGESRERNEMSLVQVNGARMEIAVGDSRQGWVSAYQTLLEASSAPALPPELEISVDLSGVRAAGEPLRGFGGVANPVKLPDLFLRCAEILNASVGRHLTSIECCLLIDEAAACVVAGNIRRSAGMRQFGADDVPAATAKLNLWERDAGGKWRIDPKKDAMRMANHTRAFHSKPSREECIESVRQQYRSGEGAIQWAGEAVARANRDILSTPVRKGQFLRAYAAGAAKEWLRSAAPDLSEEEIEHRISRWGLNPCGEILGSDFHCNLAEVHLNRLSPFDEQEQKEAFKAASLSAAALLNHKFLDSRYQHSREIDPIVGVSFTGLFDFFVAAFGVQWLKWWESGRPLTEKGRLFKRRECEYLSRWASVVQETVWDYCDRHGLKRPNRCTTVQPSGTKSLLTGASPGWHPPKAARFLRRITFRREDPVALACLDFGYRAIPSQSDKDENGNLIADPFDPRCREWLIEIPSSAPWADMPGADAIDVSKFSALAQVDFYFQVQNSYSQHNTSATIELRENEIEQVGGRIFEAIRDDEGYVSVALLSRFDDFQSFPRLPFEPISKEQYESLLAGVVARQKSPDFAKLLSKRDLALVSLPLSYASSGPAGCDSDKCLLSSSEEKA